MTEADHKRRNFAFEVRRSQYPIFVIPLHLPLEGMIQTLELLQST